MSKKKGSGNYFIFDRLFYLMSCESVYLESYLKKFEITKSTEKL